MIGVIPTADTSHQKYWKANPWYNSNQKMPFQRMLIQGRCIYIIGQGDMIMHVLLDEIIPVLL